MKKISEVFETHDYIQFKYINGNRLIKKGHVTKIYKSMKRKMLFTPMIVNEKMEIIDGQHRFQAREKIGAPIPFIIKKGYGLIETQILNENSQKWSIDDRLHTFCVAGLKDYLIFKEFREKYKIPNRESMNLLMGTINYDYNPVFKAGAFKIEDYNGGINQAEKITEIPGIKPFKVRNFINAMQIAFLNPDYDHKKFLRKLSYQSTKLVKCVSRKDYMALIEHIHDYKDYGTTQKLRLF